MKLNEIKFILTFDDGNRVVWGVPDFLSEEEGHEFLKYVNEQLLLGASQYFFQCCGGDERREGSGSEGGFITMSITPDIPKKIRPVINEIKLLTILGNESIEMKIQERNRSNSLRMSQDLQSNLGRGLGYE